MSWFDDLLGINPPLLRDMPPVVYDLSGIFRDQWVVGYCKGRFGQIYYPREITNV